MGLCVFSCNSMLSLAFFKTFDDRPLPNPVMRDDFDGIVQTSDSHQGAVIISFFRLLIKLVVLKVRIFG